MVGCGTIAGAVNVETTRGACINSLVGWVLEGCRAGPEAGVPWRPVRCRPHPVRAWGRRQEVRRILGRAGRPPSRNGMRSARSRVTPLLE